MRQCVLVLALFGCAHAAPPWPKPSVSDADGGESLAPRRPRSVAVAAKETKPELKPEVAKPAPTEAKPAAAPPTESAAPAAPPPPAAALDEEGEETMVIEIED